MSRAAAFKKEIGAELAATLGPEFKFFKSRMELRRTTAFGHQSVVLTGSNKWSPFISVALCFGVNFEAARNLERLRGKKELAYYHIHQNSLNVRHMDGLGYGGPNSWDVDVTAPPPDLVQQLERATKGIAFPFFERFRDMKAARDALVVNDWCLGGNTFWQHVLYLDAALDDIAHFEAWSQEALTDFYQQQACLELRLLKAKLGTASGE